MKHPDIHAVLDDTLDGGAAYRLPELPNFGVFYINIPSAATLIVEDLKRNNQRVRFGMYDDADGSTEEREKNFQKGVAELISDLQMRLLHAVEHGKLKYFTKSRTLEDFLQKGDQMCLPELTFIHYTDLIAWLTHFGYIDRLISTDHPAFEEYERNELDLMENLENDVIVRRGSLGKRIQSPLRVLVPPASQDDERLQLQEQLAGAFMSLRELKRENEELHARVGEVKFAPLNEKAKRSYLRLIGALCKKAKIDINGTDTVGQLARDTLVNKRRLSKSTIAHLLEQVDVEMTGKVPEKPSSPSRTHRKGGRVDRRRRAQNI